MKTRIKKLYLLKQDVNTDYNTFDSAVVVAYSREEARGIHPSGDQSEWDREYWERDWVSKPEEVEVKYLGRASGVKLGVVLASYNAG